MKKTIAILLSLLLAVLMAPGFAEEEPVQIPAELVGNWTGVGTPENGGTPIDLNITIAEDGSGSYLFKQGPYEESFPFNISYTDNTFAVDIPETAGLGTVTGTYELREDGILVLNISVAFTAGGSYAYTAECTKAAGVPEEFVGTWQGTGDFDIVLTGIIREDGTGSYVFEQNGYREEGEFNLSFTDNTFSLTNPTAGVLNGAEGTYVLEDGVLTLNISSLLASGRVYSYSVSLTRTGDAPAE